MPAEMVARTRRSGLVSTFGVGALVPSQDDSFMICGLDDGWGRSESISEPRLAASLGVADFRLPPSSKHGEDVPAVRFPEWVFCPECRALGPHFEICVRKSRRCGKCSAGAIVSPSRFVACCQNGHIEDFPYRAWAHQRADITHEGHGLRLVARGQSSALSDLVVTCSCGVSRSLDGAFGRSAFQGLKRCSGNRPWLGDKQNDCSEDLRTLQRGSSNVWFAETRSAISIPSVPNRADAFVQSRLKDLDDEVPSEVLTAALKPPEGVTKEELKAAIDRARGMDDGIALKSEQDLRAEEYQALVHGLDESSDDKFFKVEEVDLTGTDIPDKIALVSAVERLREVRALTGFSRVVPSMPDSESRPSPLVKNGRPTWLPAIEVLGEGVFVQLDRGLLDHWCDSEFARERSEMLEKSKDRVGEQSLGRRLDISPQTLVLHTLAHVLIDEMALSAGYPAASLRERLYDGERQAGILIYTATADSAGSLGGLAALSEAERFSQTLESAIRRARWCTSDPVCAESQASGVDGLNLAACHACVLLPETSCERFNLTLDRASLVGVPARDHVGFFGDYAPRR